MIQVRRGIFETNSSSSHSIVVMKEVSDFSSIYTPEEFKEEIYLSSPEYDKYGVVTIYTDDLLFDRYPFKFLCTFFDKVRYAIAAMCGSYQEHSSKKLKKIKKIVKKYIPEFKDFEFYNYSGVTIKYGLIDHQSNGLFKKFLKDKNISLEDFLIHKRYIIVIDGDEYRDFEKYKDHKLFPVDLIESEFREGVDFIEN